jgi:hypothetical protein
MSDRQKHMKPQTLNDVLLLKANRHLWGPGLLQEILNDARNVQNGDDDVEGDEDEDSDYDY